MRHLPILKANKINECVARITVVGVVRLKKKKKRPDAFGFVSQ